MDTPRLGTMVHYRAHGTPPREDGSQAHPGVCRAALVTGTTQQGAAIHLVALTPTGHHHNVSHHDPAGWGGGTWHTPAECPDQA